MLPRWSFLMLMRVPYHIQWEESRRIGGFYLQLNAQGYGYFPFVVALMAVECFSFLDIHLGE